MINFNNKLINKIFNKQNKKDKIRVLSLMILKVKKENNQTIYQIFQTNNKIRQV